MVMEFAPLGSMDHVLMKADEDGREVNNLVMIELGRQVSDAVAHLHHHGVVHRDLAVRNVLADGLWPLAVCHESYNQQHQCSRSNKVDG